MSTIQDLWAEFCPTVSITSAVYLLMWFARLFDTQPRPFLCRPGEFPELVHLPASEREDVLGGATRILLRSVRGVLPALVWAVFFSIGSLWRVFRDHGLFPDSRWIGVAFSTAFIFLGYSAAKAVERALLHSLLQRRAP